MVARKYRIVRIWRCCLGVGCMNGGVARQVKMSYNKAIAYYGGYGGEVGYG
jgi:hypothetical protein